MAALDLPERAAVSEPRDWEVFDHARDRTPMEQLMGNDCPADFGPMTEREARALVQIRPSAFWARRIRSTSAGSAGEGL